MVSAGRRPWCFAGSLNHGRDSTDVPADAAGTSRKPRMRLHVSDGRRAQPYYSGRNEFTGVNRRATVNAVRKTDCCPFTAPAGLVKDRPRYGYLDPHVTPPRVAEASTILDRQQRSTLARDESRCLGSPRMPAKTWTKSGIRSGSFSEERNPVKTSSIRDQIGVFCQCALMYIKPAGKASGPPLGSAAELQGGEGAASPRFGFIQAERGRKSGVDASWGGFLAKPKN